MSVIKGVLSQGAWRKVKGSLAFTADQRVAGEWTGLIVRSPVEKGRLVSIKPAQATDLTDAILITAKDIPGVNRLDSLDNDMPCLAETKITHIGQAIALVAARDPNRARDLADRLEITIEPTPSAPDPFSYLGRDNPDGDNPQILLDYRLQRGTADVPDLSDLREHESTFRISSQIAPALERPEVVAAPNITNDTGILTLIAARGLTRLTRHLAATLCDLPQTHIRFQGMASAQGSDRSRPPYNLLAVYAALLAHVSGHPVRMQADSYLDHSMESLRSRFAFKLKALCDAKGELQYLAGDIVMDAGPYVGLAPLLLNRALLHLAGVYRCPNLKLRARAIASNAPPPPHSARGGTAESLFAIECHLDRVARDLGVNAIDIRWRNIVRLGDRMATGLRIQDTVGAAVCLEDIARRSHFDTLLKHIERENPRQKTATSKGLGLSLYFSDNPDERALAGRIKLRLLADGRLEVSGMYLDDAQDQMMVRTFLAARLGITAPQIRIRQPRKSGKTISSQITARPAVLEMRLLKQAADRLRDTIAPLLGEGASFENDCFLLKGGERLSWQQAAQIVSDTIPLAVESAWEFPPQSTGRHSTQTACPRPLSWGAVAAEVEVDRETFDIRVVQLWLSCDIGQASAKTNLHRRIEADALHALGFALCDNRRLTDANLIADRIQAYMHPSALDAPALHVNIVDAPLNDDQSPPKNLNALPIYGVAAAVNNAVFHALGIAANHLPVTPERLFEAKYLHKDGTQP